MNTGPASALPKTGNRDYDYSSQPLTQRPEFETIARLVPQGARVIDLACGNGSLLELLAARCGARGFGIERSGSGVEQARAKGLEVVRGDVDQPWPSLADDSFDVAICNVTIMMVMYPEVLLREMGRIAPISIVSFTNFAFVVNRFELLLTGRMPRHGLYGHSWYDTGCIHQLSLRDFDELCGQVGLRVRRAVMSSHPSRLRRALASAVPNLLASTPVLELERVRASPTPPRRGPRAA
jgi:methionine biosynthesis protein MetW